MRFHILAVALTTLASTIASPFERVNGTNVSPTTLQTIATPVANHTLAKRLECGSWERVPATDVYECIMDLYKRAQGDEYCAADPNSPYYPPIFCEYGRAKVLGISNTGRKEESLCRDVATAVSHIHWNCRAQGAEGVDFVSGAENAAGNGLLRIEVRG